MSRPQRPRATARDRRLRVALTLAAALVLVVAPVADAASATNINVQLPAGFSIAGTIRNSSGAALPDASILAIGPSFEFAESDGTGKYKVQGLVPGQYQILVQASGATNLVDGYYTTANANHHTPSSAAATKITVGPNKTGIDVKLPAGYTITGYIKSTGGTALSGASVSASGVSYDGTSTDATGKYTLRGLAAGAYKLSVQSPFNTNYLSGWFTTANANRFTIAAGSASNVSVGPNKTGVNIKLPTGYTISGLVTNTSGTPLPNVSIQPTSSTYNGRSVVTDSAGKYTLKGLAAATYKLAVSPGFSSAYMDGWYTTTNANHFHSQASGASGIAVGPNKTGINIKVVTGHTISGTVTTTGGAPIANESVSASNLGHTRSAMTDAAGKYTIKGLSSGSQIIQLQPPYGQNFMSGFYTTSNANHFTSVQSGATAITVGPSKTGINVKVVAGYKISGKITGPGGAPAAYASIYASKTGYGGSTITNADGTYTVQGLGSGTYKVLVYAPYESNWQSGYYTTANSAHFTLSAASASGVTIGP